LLTNADTWIAELWNPLQEVQNTLAAMGENDEGFMSEAWLQGEGLAMACLFNFEGSAIRQGLFLLTSACKSKDEQSACCCVGSAMFCQGGGVQRRGNRDLVFRCLLQLFAKGSGCCG
jgi:hypothetical protein